MKVFSGWGGRTEPGSQRIWDCFPGSLSDRFYGLVNKLVKNAPFSDDDVKRTDGNRVLGQWAGFGLLQFFIVQMKRVNIIHSDRAA